MQPLARSLGMISVARQWEIPNVHIHGFMADNASGGWNAIRRVFTDGIRDPERERSDAFHWAQSLHWHTCKCIKEGSRARHLALWNMLRDAKNLVEAYCISQDIAAWWKEGNAHPEKIKELNGWMAWWVVRWTQWGNYIRLVSILQVVVVFLNMLFLSDLLQRLSRRSR